MKMRTQIKTLIKTLPHVPVYFYLLFLAITSTSLFIFLLMVIQ